MIKYFQDDILQVVNLIRHKINESEKLQVVQKEISRRCAAVIGIIDESQGKPVFQKSGALLQQVCCKIWKKTD